MVYDLFDLQQNKIKNKDSDEKMYIYICLNEDDMKVTPIGTRSMARNYTEK